MKYILIGLLLCCCQNIPRHNASLKYATEALDTIKSTTAKVIAVPDLFETAFIKGTIRHGKSATANFYGVTIGKIKIVSGHIIACDPGHIDEYGIPFTQTFPIGEFPVQLSIINVEGEESIAFSRINFSEEPVAKWEFALLKEQSPLPVGGNEKHGYSTDLGAGIFMDEAASEFLDKSNLTDLDADLYKQMDAHYRDNWKYAMYSFGAHNLAAFTSGLGDGRYATYIGFEAEGKPCRLLTDFNLIDWKK